MKDKSKIVTFLNYKTRNSAQIHVCIKYKRKETEHNQMMTIGKVSKVKTLYCFDIDK